MHWNLKKVHFPTMVILASPSKKCIHEERCTIMIRNLTSWLRKNKVMMTMSSVNKYYIVSRTQVTLQYRHQRARAKCQYYGGAHAIEVENTSILVLWVTQWGKLSVVNCSVLWRFLQPMQSYAEQIDTGSLRAFFILNMNVIWKVKLLRSVVVRSI